MTTKNANKAALYSIFVFPGAGLWWLKQYKRACIFMVPTIGALWYIINILYSAIAPVYQKMLRDAEEGILVVDVSSFPSIYMKLHNEMYSSLSAQQAQLQAAEVILVAAWLCSIAASYFVGKKMDLKSSAAKP
jgi:hypothetical protein